MPIEHHYCTWTVFTEPTNIQCGARAVWNHPTHKIEWLCQRHYEILMDIERDYRGAINMERKVHDPRRD
jgi:hypothetical protein